MMRRLPDSSSGLPNRATPMAKFFWATCIAKGKVDWPETSKKRFDSTDCLQRKEMPSPRTIWQIFLNMGLEGLLGICLRRPSSID